MGCPSSGQLRIIAPLSPVASMAQGYRAVRGILIFDMAFVAVVMVPSEPESAITSDGLHACSVLPQ
jgi:hypothetical protein